ncbi:hypothetical protein BAE42_15645 [Mesorhizobium loti]|nr:hypothetical protein BAE42_15645 [Mesorhizobium loti]OBQ62481.1 hypothetical protein A8146_15145 [Mesorhizobium loti]
MSAFLVLRGLKKTLTLRIEWHSTTALAIAQVPVGHSAVAWVSSPSSTRIPIKRLPETDVRIANANRPGELDQQVLDFLKKAPAKSAMALWSGCSLAAIRTAGDRFEGTRSICGQKKETVVFPASRCA